MKYMNAARHLKESVQPGRVADFFISPVHHPDLIMSILIEKERHNLAAKSKKTSAPTRARSTRLQKAKTCTKKQSGWWNPFKLVMRYAFLLGVLMFISCAFAPHSIISETPVIKQVRQPHSLDRDDLGVSARLLSPWDAAKELFKNGAFTRPVTENFAGRLFSGDWAGLALISQDGNVSALARKGSYSSVSQWLENYKELEDENRWLRTSFHSLQRVRDQRKIYMEINLAEDLLFVKMNTQVLYKFPIVSGKNFVPRDSRRRPRFRTPRGILTVKRKELRPVWHPPAWFWTERGAEIPERRFGIRGVLGKYRLNLGNGYGIHGTRNGRIGRPGKRSHGCIRMNEKDLELVYQLADKGTQVYVY